MMMTAMAISPTMRNVLSVATMLPTDVMASDTATIAPTIVPIIRRMSPLCAPGPLAGHGRSGPCPCWLSGRFCIHDLRHTAVSLMIQAGYPPKMLQEIMGRASIATTLDLYGHLYPGDMDRYADRLGDAAEEADPAKSAQMTRTTIQLLRAQRCDLRRRWRARRDSNPQPSDPWIPVRHSWTSGSVRHLA